jgi:hypothetical protein
MALTKKDLLEAIEDMPMDAKVYIDIGDDYKRYNFVR